MLDFETFITRHGEVVAQAVLENLERYEGVQTDAVASLEQRWQALLAQDGPGQGLAA